MISTPKNHKDLIVWQESRSLVKAIYEVSENFPTKEQFALTSQLRRAAISVPANIAEGNARGRKEYAHFVSIAFGSLSELDTLLLLAEDLNYIEKAISQKLREDIAKIARMANKLMQALRKTSP